MAARLVSCVLIALRLRSTGFDAADNGLAEGFAARTELRHAAHIALIAAPRAHPSYLSFFPGHLFRLRRARLPLAVPALRFRVSLGTLRPSSGAERLSAFSDEGTQYTSDLQVSCRGRPVGTLATPSGGGTCEADQIAAPFVRVLFGARPVFLLRFVRGVPHQHLARLADRGPMDGLSPQRITCTRDRN
jgi:hypothetical protein